MSNIIDKIRLSGTDYTLSATTSGVSVVEVTQDEYDALPTSAKTDTSKMYVITDAEAGDLTNYYTKTETNTLLGGKQATLVSGTNIKTINNESLLGSGNIDIQGGGGGGKAVTGGTNISVTTGATADTINCTLPIIKGVNLGATSREHSVMIGYDGQQYVGNYIKKDYSASIGFTNTIDADRSVCLGSDNYANGYCSIAMNQANSAMTNYSVASGYRSKTSNEYEFASGQYNNSVSGSSTFGDSGNTLFSVGNGTADNARHNAFEIRQNGDIYLTSGGTDIKLQDYLGGGGGGSSYSAGNGIDITNNVISVTGMVATSSIATAVTSSSTDSEVPSAKCLYDAIGDIETLLSQI